MIGRSLKTRLLAGLIIAQSLAIMAAMLIFPLVAPFFSFDDIADATFRARIEASIRQDADALWVAATPALTRYLMARPGARFAVASAATGQVITGSDAELSDRLERLKSMFPRPAGNLVTSLRDGGPPLIITAEDTPHGRLVFATVGNAFHAEDLPSLMTAFLPVVLPAYGPVIIGALVLLPLVVGVVIRPLRRLGAEAAKITPGTLDLRLDGSGLGSELQALVGAINEALARVEDGVARQRLYAANAAHELRTPVAILAMHLEELPDGAPKVRARGDVARIATLVDQLVTVARLGQNHVVMDERIDLIELVRNVIADRAPLAIRNGRDIELRTAPGAIWIAGNRQALTSALANVVENAVRAEPDGGSVVVELSADGRLDIVDHGEGILPAHRSLIFEPFWRKSEETPGAGLGLAIVKEIIDRHHIKVDVLDTLGGGATFRFCFQTIARPHVKSAALSA